MVFRNFEITVSNLGIVEQEDFNKKLDDYCLLYGFYDGKNTTISDEVCEKLSELNLEVENVFESIDKKIKQFCGINLYYSNIGIYINDCKKTIKLDIFLYQTVEQNNIEFVKNYLTVLPQDYIYKIVKFIKLTQKRKIKTFGISI